jgi:quercetin dioxygenase-like cupin family protein
MPHRPLQQDIRTVAVYFWEDYEEGRRWRMAESEAVPSPGRSDTWFGVPARGRTEETLRSELAIYALTREEGQALWFLNTRVVVKATGEQTGGAFGLIEQVLPAGFASPYHVHHAEEETFYVLEGEATFISGGRKIKATAGSYVFLPRDIPHGFKVDAPTRLLILTTPSGFEQFVIEMSEPAADSTTPPTSPPDMGRLMSLAAKYQIEILGPLPE